MSRDALVVGVNTYQYLPSLKAPAQDAEAIAQQLHCNGEFRVHRLPEVIQAGKPQVGRKTPVTLRELETALINLFKPRGSNVPQTAVFYFSGHGIQRDAGIQEGYLALSDSNPDQGFYGLSLFWLRRLLQESPVRQRIIWLDCCHSGELLNFLEADPGAHPGTDRLFMAASREYETAYESLEGEYSVFTNALLTGLDPSRIPAGVVTNHALTDWVNQTLKGEIQQPLFESSGSEIILTRQGAGQAKPCPTAHIQSTDICPYRGLEFFDELHADYFFGREALTTQLLDKIAKDQFVAITGASGSGKSSLIRAGLMVQLRQGKKIVGSDQWKVRLITPTEHPLKSLASAFIDPELVDLERAEQLRRAETFLQDGGTGLAQLVRASLPTDSSTRLPAQRPRFLLVIDQFEEVFTLSQGSQAERERQEFFDCLIGALAMAKDWLKIVIVLRADFSSKCALYEGLIQQIAPHQIVVTPLKYEQIKSTIVRPAQKVGLVCEPNLVYTMMMDVIGAPGELPLLQYTLLELWRKRRVGKDGGVARLTLDAYQELGGVRGTLQKRATEVFESLSLEEQSIAKRIFLALTQLGEGTEDTRRRVSKTELVSPTFPITLVDQVLEKLVAAKLVVINQELSQDNSISPTSSTASSLSDQIDPHHPQATAMPGAGLASVNPVTSTRTQPQEIVDVTHEALIRNWSLLRGWLEASRDVLRRLRRLEQAAQEWDQAGQPTTGSYLLSGLRLRDAEDFIKLHPQELSALGQQYISVSCAECMRIRRQSRRSQIVIPSALVATLALVLSQSYGVIRTQTEKENQLQKAKAYEQTALAQAVLQDSAADPTTALLLSRLAAQGGETGYATQASLRSALQNLRLQVKLQGHQGTVQQVQFSPDYRYLGTAGADGTIRLWSVDAQTIYNTDLQATKVLHWTEPALNQAQNQAQQARPQSAIQAIRFSPDGRQIAAIAQGSAEVRIWAVDTGAVVTRITGTNAIKQISFSATGEWLATLDAAGSVSLWNSGTGELKAQLPQRAIDLQIGADNMLLTAGEDGTAQLWQLGLGESGQLTPQLIKTLTHPDVVYQARFSPSGLWINTLSKDGQVRVWDRQTGQLQRSLLNSVSSLLPEGAKVAEATQPSAHPSSAIQQMELSPDEQTLATTDANHQVWLWNTQSGQLQAKLGGDQLSETPSPETPSLETSILDLANHSDSTGLVQFSPTGEMVVTTEASGNSAELYSAYLWNRQTGARIGKLSGHLGKITAVQFSPDGTYIVTASADGAVRLWSAELGGELPSVQLPGQLSSETATWISLFPGGTTQNISSDASSTPSSSAPQPSGQPPVRQLTNWEPPDLTQAQAARANTSITKMVAVDPTGRLQQWRILTHAFTPSRQGPTLPQRYTAAIQSQNAASNLRYQLMSLLPFRSFETSKSLTPGFAQLLQGLTSAMLPPSPVFLESTPNLDLAETNAAFSSFAISSDQLLLAKADIKGRISVYKNMAGQAPQLLYQIDNWRSNQANATTLSQVVTTTSINQANANQQTLDETPTPIHHLVFSPNGRQLLGVADDLTMRTWDARSGQALKVFRGHEAAIRQARYSADGQWVISASWDKTARIWQADTAELSKVLPHEDAVSSASFSPDGQQIVIASWDGTAQIWQTDRGKPQFLLHKHQKSVVDAQFSPDGSLVVTASTDGTARLWKADSGEEQALLSANPTGEPEALMQAFFSPDGQYVATLSKSGRVNLWAATWDMLLNLARERSLRQLTPDECNRYLKLSPEQCPQLPS